MPGPVALYFTDDADANRLLAEDPLALLIGLVLYQQVPVEKAFSGPAALQERLEGRLDAGAIAAMDPEALESIFKERPAIHRFPTAMAKRTQALCAHLSEIYGGRPDGVWMDAADAGEIIRRLKGLPGFGDYKSKVTFTVLAKRLEIRLEGWEQALANFPSVGDIDGPGQLNDFKARKKAWKASYRSHEKFAL